MRKFFKCALSFLVCSVLSCTVLTANEQQQPTENQESDLEGWAQRTWGYVCTTASAVSNVLTKIPGATNALKRIRVRQNEPFKDMSVRLFLTGTAGAITYEVAHRVLDTGSSLGAFTWAVPPVIASVLAPCSVAAKFLQKPLASLVSWGVMHETSNYFSKHENLETVYTLGFNKMMQAKEWIVNSVNTSGQNAQ